MQNGHYVSFRHHVHSQQKTEQVLRVVLNCRGPMKERGKTTISQNIILHFADLLLFAMLVT